MRSLLKVLLTVSLAELPPVGKVSATESLLKAKRSLFYKTGRPRKGKTVLEGSNSVDCVARKQTFSTALFKWHTVLNRSVIQELHRPP